MNEQFILKIGVGRSKDETRCVLTVYDFREFLGGERTTFDYDCFCKCKDLSADPVDLWQVVPAHFDGSDHLIMLVDEEGLLHSPQDPVNLVASVSANIGYPICGDVFICHDQGEDMAFLSWTDIVRIFDNFSLIPSEPVLVH